VQRPRFEGDTAADRSPHVSRRTVLGTGAATAALTLGSAPSAYAAKAPSTRDVTFRAWRGTGLGTGTSDGTVLSGGALVLGGTNGHLLVIRGFTSTGDVVVNDPASHLIADDAQVRVVYDREQFENVWVPHSGGIVYVIHPAGVALPTPPPDQANW
jgi:hypothetical protein